MLYYIKFKMPYKNKSKMLEEDDLLSTGSYHTRAFANEGADWPAVYLAIPLPGATTGMREAVQQDVPAYDPEPRRIC